MNIITLASGKGGTGKSTLAAHLAVEAGAQGVAPVAIVDLDPQGTLAAWWNSRDAETPHFIKTTVRSLAKDLDTLQHAGGELIVIDTPPALLDVVNAGIAVADLVLIPVRPSPHDLRAVGLIVEMARKLNTPFAFVINAATARSRLVHEARQALVEHGQVLLGMTCQRQIFASAMIDGRTAGEIDLRSPAAEEMTALWRDVHVHLQNYGKRGLLWRNPNLRS
jgi:chromosome partitioning protein